METPKKIKVIKKDAVLSIKMSAAFYLRCKAIAAYLIEDKSNDEINNAYTRIKEQNIDQPWIEHLETILVLCAEFDKQANETGNIQELTEEEIKQMISLKEDQK
jgi:hypothetical protein